MRFLCNNLPVQDQRVQDILKTTAATVATVSYNVERLFKPPEVGPEFGDEAIASSSGEPPAKKLRTSEDTSSQENVIEYKTKMTREGTCSMTTLHCDCGVKKVSAEALKAHIEKHHDCEGGIWTGAYEGCGKVFKVGKSLRKHVRNYHLTEFLYWCKYCNYGKDQRHLVINHLFNKHTIGVQIPCSNLGCPKMFPSKFSLNEHDRYCQRGK